MKKYLSAILAVTVIAGIYGCGDNKTKEKLLGTSVVTSNSTSGTYTSNPTAASVTALYKVSFLGAGAGNFSYSAPRRGAPQRAPSGDAGTGLGTPNADGEYVISDPMGMTIKIAFKMSGQTVYMDFANTFGSSGLYMFAAQSLTSTKYTLSGGDPNDIMTALLSSSLYIPSFWIKASNGQPSSWYEVTTAKMMAGLTDMSSWMTETAFPDSMTNTVTGKIPGGTISMTMTSAGMTGRPTDASPSTMTGSGTITFDTGEVLTVTSNMSIGASGPVSGTQTFSSTSGQSGTMTFASDGSMTGTISMSGVVVATVNIKADGTGTYTDVSTGKTYSISDAKPK